MSAEQVRPGYQLTEVGVIPEDWEVKPLDQIAVFLDSQRKPVKDSDRLRMQGDIPYYGASGVIDYVDDYLFDDELILLAEDGENILSRSSRVAFRISGKAWVNNHAHVLKPKDMVDIGYVTEYLESLDYSQYNSGSAQPKLNKQVCLSISIPLPPLPEQRAIAAALGDVDALLAGLERLIAKRRAVKQAAMDALLSGRVRLPGFGQGAGHRQSEVGVIPEDWEVKRIGEICVQFLNGGTPSTKIPEYWTGNIPWITGADLADQEVKQVRRYITEDAVRNSATNIIAQGNLLVATRTGIGKVAIAGFDLAISQDLTGVYLDNEIALTEYVYRVLDHQSKNLITFSQGTSITGVTREDFASIVLPLPSLPEQRAIAAVLSDMDAAIAALARQRDKVQALKQGMMAELLTGRVRLVGPPAAPYNDDRATGEEKRL
jgi:type I restriction enzyme S subunit